MMTWECDRETEPGRGSEVGLSSLWVVVYYWVNWCSSFDRYCVCVSVWESEVGVSSCWDVVSTNWCNSFDRYRCDGDGVCVCKRERASEREYETMYSMRKWWGSKKIKTINIHKHTQVGLFGGLFVIICEGLTDRKGWTETFIKVCQPWNIQSKWGQGQPAATIQFVHKVSFQFKKIITKAIDEIC